MRQVMNCGQCNQDFKTWQIVDGKKRNLCNRIRCLTCQPLETKIKRLEKDFRTCSYCKKDLPNNKDFFYKKSDGYNHTNQCKECFKKHYHNRHKKIKQQCVEYKGGSCIKCGYSKSFAALEFHHIDPSQKDFEISRAASSNMNFEKIKIELDKCILVCSNCHKEEHENKMV